MGKTPARRFAASCAWMSCGNEMATAPIERLARNCLRSNLEAPVILSSFSALIVEVVSIVDQNRQADSFKENQPCFRIHSGRIHAGNRLKVSQAGEFLRAAPGDDRRRPCFGHIQYN